MDLCSVKSEARDEPIKCIKTKDLEEEKSYNIVYMRKVSTVFGKRIRVFFDVNTVYDLPISFLQKLNRWDLDETNYDPVKFVYKGRATDAFGTLLIDIEGLPPLPNKKDADEQPEGEEPDTVPETGDLPPPPEIEPPRQPERINMSISKQNTKQIQWRKKIFRPDVFGPDPSKSLQQKEFIHIEKIKILDHPVYVTEEERKKLLHKNINSENMCSICFCNKNNNVFYPCGHKLCNICSSKFLSQKKQKILCCFCRAVVKDIIQIYNC